MTHGCDAAEQISYPTPPKTNIFRNSPVLGNHVRELVVDVLSPIDVVAIGRISQAGEKRILEMVVRVDEAGQNQEPGKINRRVGARPRPRRRTTEDADYLTFCDPYGSACGFLWIDRASRSVNRDFLTVHVFRIRDTGSHN